MMKIKNLGLVEYLPTWHSMQEFTDNRTVETSDEIWVVEHPPVFTQGQAGKAEHILHATDIPIVQTDRGGQVTYHGPGQLVIYPLLDLRRLKMGVRQLVTAIEDSVVEALADYDIAAAARKDAPGVYAKYGDNEQDKKIASLGLRVRKGCSFHGVAINIDMDLSPFRLINPCGLAMMQMVQLADFAKARESGDKSILMTEMQNRFLMRFSDKISTHSNISQ